MTCGGHDGSCRELGFVLTLLSCQLILFVIKLRSKLQHHRSSDLVFLEPAIPSPSPVLEKK